MAEIFVVAPPRTFRRDVPIVSPDGSEKRIDIEWVWKDKDELDAWTAEMRVNASALTLAAVIDTWYGVADESGALVKFSPDALQWLCGKYPTAPLHLFLGYLNAMTDGRRKN